MSVLTWHKPDGYLVMADGSRIQCWSKVRNELNGLRPRKKLYPGNTDVYLATGDIAAMPRVFPIGEWTILGVKEHPDPTEQHGYLYPAFVRTDAVSKVPEWLLDDKGCYLKPSGRMIDDRDLGLHFSTCDWTDGCIRIATYDELMRLWHGVSIGDRLVVTE
jgi:hypothetical protein